MGTKSFENQAISNVDRRPYTFGEREIARVFESFTQVLLPSDTHPRELYGIPTPPNTDDALNDILRDVGQAAEDRRLGMIAIARDALVEYRLQCLRRFWHRRQRKMLEVAGADERQLPAAQREAIREVRRKRKGPDLARAFETFYAEILRRTAQFKGVVLSNDLSDILAGSDLFVNITSRGRKTRWAPIDLSTGESPECYKTKMEKDNTETLPIPALHQKPEDGMPDPDTVLYRRVEFMDFYVLRVLHDRLEQAAVERRLTPIEEIWVKAEEGWFLSIEKNPPTGMETWKAPTPQLENAEFLLLLGEAFEDAPALRQKEQNKYGFPDPDPGIVAKWPTSVDDMIQRVQRDLYDAKDPVDKRYFGWKNLVDAVNAPGPRRERF